MSSDNDLPTKLRTIQSFLKEHNLDHAFSMLLYSDVLLNSRMNLFRESMQTFRNAILGIPVDNVSVQTISRIHIIQLDIISKLFTMLEDYLSYSVMLSKDRQNLHNAIAADSRNIIWLELTRLEGMTETDIRRYLLLPETDNLDLSSEDREFVDKILESFVSEIHGRIGRITKFFSRYDRVYMKYKHVFPAIIGLFDMKDGNVSTQIYIRDSLKGEKSTYILPTDIEVLNYYEELGEDIFRTFYSIIMVNIHSLQNLDKPFLIPDAYFIPKEHKKRWSEITAKVDFYPAAIGRLGVKVAFDLETSRDIYEGFRKDFIYGLNRDVILGSEFTRNHSNYQTVNDAPPP